MERDIHKTSEEITDNSVDTAEVESVANQDEHRQGNNVLEGPQYSSAKENITTENNEDNITAENIEDVGEPSIISLKHPIKLEYCSDDGCNCGLVHCPFCSSDHYKPAAPFKVRDHMELRHFAHAVQFDDLLVVKCFKICDDKPSGHYHCPSCERMLIKRTAFRQHLLSHAKKMGENPGFVKAPDDKLPQKMYFKGVMMEQCSLSCSSKPHLHCYLCDELFIDRSMLVIHMWRCKGQIDIDPVVDPRTNCQLDSDIKQHISIVRKLEDLPVERCTNPECTCKGRYHCAICPQSKFKPNFITHLKCHYLSHWRKRILYKGYSILICYLECESKSGKRATFHYHCPVCGGTRRRRSGFIHHLKICQGDRLSTHRFSMNQTKRNSMAHLEQNIVDVKCIPHVDEVEQATGSILHSEDCLPSDAFDQTRDKEEQVYNDAENISNVEEIVTDETSETFSQKSDIKIFETVVGTLSQTLVDSMDHDRLMMVLQQVTGQTETSVEQAPGTVTPVYTLSGQPQRILQAQNVIKKIIYKDTSQDDDKNAVDCTNCGCEKHVCVKCGEGLASEESFTVAETENTEESPVVIRRSRGRPRKNKSIIDSENSNSLTNEPSCPTEDTAIITRKKRGRPPKQKPSVTQEDDEEYKPKSSKVIIVDKSVKDDRGKRYSTRGIIKDFSIMAGVKKYTEKPKDIKYVRYTTSVEKETTLFTDSSIQQENADNEMATEPCSEINLRPKCLKEEQTVSSDKPSESLNEGDNCQASSADSNIAFVPTVTFDVLPYKRGRKTVRENTKFDSNAEEKEDTGISVEDPVKDVEAGLQCQACDFFSDHFCEVTLHIKTVHGDEADTRCDICEMVFCAEDDLWRHVDQSHGPFAFSGIVQNQHNMLSRKTKSIINTKTNSKKNTEYHCPKCSFKTWNINSYHTHKENVHGEMPDCEHCGKKFARHVHLHTHVQAVHTKSRASVCHVCGKNFNHVRYLKAHLKRHLGVKNHACSICGRRFIESNTLRMHMETHKPVEDRQYRFVCNYCGKRFFNKTSYSDHLNKHTGHKPYSCEICGKAFAFKSIMDKHKLFLHTTDKPFKCDVCFKGFKLQRLLDQHMVSHTGQSNFTCDGCSRAFSCKNTLKIHQQKCKVITISKLNTGAFFVLSEQNLNKSETAGELSSVVLQQPQDIVLAPEEGFETQDVENAGIENSVLVESQVVNEGTEPALYLCSECNAVFDSFSAAEKHVLMGHLESKEKEELAILPSEQLENIGQFVDSDTVFTNVTDQSTSVVESNLQETEWQTHNVVNIQLQTSENIDQNACN